MNKIPTTVKNKDLVEKRREQIVLAAIKLFSQNGFHKTTLRDLSEEAGISYGNIYDYIGSKDDIFYLIHAYLCDRVFEELERAVENIDDPLEKLRRMVRAEFNFMDGWSDGILLLYQEGHILKSPFLQDFLKKEREHIHMFEEVISECVRKGLLRECNPRLTANIIKVTVDGWVLKRWDLRGSTSSQEAEKFILELVLLGLLPERIKGRRSPAKEVGLLSGKKALVVGAETALGAAVCSSLTASGARVCAYFNDERPLGGDDPSRRYPLGEGVAIYTARSSGPMDRALFLRIEEEFGPIDAYVHDLGVGQVTVPSPEMQEAESPAHARLLEANLQTAHEIARCLLNQMLKKPWGRVVYIAPWAWDEYLDPLRFHSVVAGTLALTRSMSQALVSSRINVNCVVPGYIKTPRPSEWQKVKYEEVQDKIPFNRLGEVSDVSNSVLFLLEDGSRYLTDQVFRVTGGC